MVGPPIVVQSQTPVLRKFNGPAVLHREALTQTCIRVYDHRFETLIKLYPMAQI